MTTTTKLRVVVATPLSEELCQLIERAEPRIELVRDQALLPPMRRPADYRGDPAFRRTAGQQADFERMLDSADVLFGIPDVNPAALRRTVEANPGLRWVQVMAAGGGSQVKSAGLRLADLDRVVFTTSAGVHGGPLAEFAIFGIMAGAKQLPALQRDQHSHAWPERRALGQVRAQTEGPALRPGVRAGPSARCAPRPCSSSGSAAWGERSPGFRRPSGCALSGPAGTTSPFPSSTN